MNHQVPWLPFVILAAVGGIALLRWWFSEAEKTKRAIRSTPKKPIRYVREGEVVKIVGRIKYLAKPMQAPLTGRLCAYFEARALERHGKNSYREVAMEKGGVEFLVDDGTGHAVVDPLMLRAAVVHDNRANSGFLREPDARMETFLSKHGQVPTSAFGFNKRMVYKEGVFEQGETIAIVGMGRFEDDPDETATTAGYRLRPKRLRIIAPQEGFILISDHPSVTGAARL